MTVPTQSPVSNHIGNGVTTAFPYGFRLLDETDITVLIDGVKKTVGIDYTVTGVDQEEGGTIVFQAAPTAASAVDLVRQVALNRLNDYQYSGDFQSVTVNRDFDRIVMMIQDSGIALSNALRLPPGDPSNGTLPIAALRALKTLAFDADGNLVLSSAAGNADILAAALLSTTPTTGSAIVGFDAGNSYPASSIGAYLAGIANKASPTLGAALLGLKLNAVGAVGRPMLARFMDQVTVKDFGAIGDGNTHPLSATYASLAAAQAVYPFATALTQEIDWCAIQAAINHVQSLGGGEVYFPAGTYMLKQALNVTGNTVTLRGATRFTTLLKQQTANAEILNITGSFFTLRGMGLQYSVTPTAGANAVHLRGSIQGVMNDFVVRSCWNGILIDTAAATHKITDFEIFDYGNCGALLTGGALDIFIRGFTMNAGAATRGLLGGIRLQDWCEAVVIECGDVLLGKYSLTMDAAANTAGQRPGYNRFSNVYFDSATDGSTLNNSALIKFIGCWFSAGRDNNLPGLTLSTSKDVEFIGTDFFNCGSHGALVNAGSTQTRFIGCSFESNSTTSGAGVAHGVTFAAGASEFTVMGCKASNGMYTGVQGYGVFVAAGTSNNVNIVDNDLSANFTGGMLFGATAGGGWTIRGNRGYVSGKSGTATLTVGNATVSVAHGLAKAPNPEDITVTPTTAPSASSVATWYVAGISGTNFEIRCNAAAATNNLGFGWSAKIPGG